jgi:hypothetical protein
MANGYAGGQYRATLQASFSHRLFLRCGRIHSGEERTPREYHGKLMQSRKEGSLWLIIQQQSLSSLLAEN